MTRLLKFLFGIAALSVLAYFAQDLWLYPALLKSKRLSFSKPQPPPRTVEKMLVAAPGDVELDVWKLVAQGRAPVALILHSERETLWDAFRLQKWFQDVGVTTYAFDYRGFGNSSGWPSEDGLVVDASAVLTAIAEKEKLAEQDILLVGSSLGASVAAELALKARSRSLVLVSPLPGLPFRFEQAKVKWIIPVLRGEFALETSLERLSDRCIVIAHGSLGRGPSAAELDELTVRAKGKNSVQRFISSTSAKTLDTFDAMKPQLEGAIGACIERIGRPKD